MGYKEDQITAIRAATDYDNAAESLELLEEQWDHVDNLWNMVESRTRILITQLEKPEQADESWMTIHGGDKTDPTTLKTVKRTLLALKKRVPQLTRPVVEASSMGGLRVSFQGDPQRSFQGDQLTWLFTPIRLSFPGMNVRAYARNRTGQLQKVKVFHQAFGLLDHAAGVLTNSPPVCLLGPNTEQERRVYAAEAVMIDFQEIVCGWMETHNKTRAELADKLNMSAEELADMLSEDGDISVKKMGAILSDLGMKLDLMNFLVPG